ncbi:MAG: AAA family ATPase, partial [Planctomycetaceae bacterium]|nr:AAA family ATPase [Planctomycetaceae bacterium]
MPKRPIRFFNTTGPCNPDDHYMLPPAERLQGAQLNRYIKDDLYWMLHAPRQTGKTTFLLNWMRELNTENDVVACYVTVERCQGMREFDVAMANICEAIQSHAETNNIPIPKSRIKTSGSQLNAILKNWAKIIAPKKLVVLFDEVDVLEDDVMISFLRQLRDGFMIRGVGKFPTSIALVGMRDLKDYLVAAKGGKPVNQGSPFNIKEDSVFIGNFSKENVVRLFAQRTAETGQQITPEALNYVWEQSYGQPWIVNSLFKRATLRILDEESRETVTLKHIEQAREQMILARETHLESLVYRLQDSRVLKVMETLMTGNSDPLMGGSEGFRLCLDLGLAIIENGTLKVANPIYREVLARQVTYGT